jgi:Lipopolysaccharide-assembly
MTWDKKPILAAVVIFLLLFYTNCVKYSFKGALPSYLKTISVPLFEDRTSWAGLREEMTTKVIDAFISDNSLRVIEDDKAADLVLEGTISRIQEKYVAISGTEQVEQKQIWVYVSVKCINQRTEKELWSGSLSDFDEVSGTAALDELNSAVSAAVDKIVEDIVNKTIAAW